MVAVELQVVALAAILFLIQMLLAGGIRFMTFGMGWAAGPRDTTPGAVSVRGQRADRAFRNMAETFPVFAALAIAVVVAGLADGLTELGAKVYIIARVLYLPAYVFHVPMLRSAIWGVALAGILMVGWPLFSFVF